MCCPDVYLLLPKSVRGKPTPATSLPGRSISCWLFDPGKVSSRGRRAHLGDIGTAKPRGGRKSFLFTTAPHALYGTRACGPVLGGEKVSYRKRLTYGPVHLGPKGSTGVTEYTPLKLRSELLRMCKKKYRLYADAESSHTLSALIHAAHLASAVRRSAKLGGRRAFRTLCHGPSRLPLLSPSTGFASLSTRST